MALHGPSVDSGVMTTSAEYREAAAALERAAEALVLAVAPVTGAVPPRVSGPTASAIAATIDVTWTNVRRAVSILHSDAVEARRRAAIIDALS